MDVERVSPPDSGWGKIKYHVRGFVASVLWIPVFFGIALAVAGLTLSVILGLLVGTLALLAVGIVIGVPTLILFGLAGSISPHEYTFEEEDE